MDLVFGPIPSRRMGLSLGYSVFKGAKVCNYSCVYCQLGASPKLYTREELESSELIASPEEVLSQLSDALLWLKRRYALEPHYLTLVPEGEPLLYPYLEELVEGLRALKTTSKLAIITNSSLVSEHYESLLKFHLVSASLDTYDEITFKLINRPHPSITFSEVIEGLLKLSKGMRDEGGHLQLEVMVVRGYNDTEEALERIAELVSLISPASVFINTPVRVPTLKLMPSERAVTYLRDLLKARGIPVNPKLFDGEVVRGVNLIGLQSLEEAVISILKRHPMSQEELSEVLGIPLEEVKRVIESKGDNLVRVRTERGTYYRYRWR